MTQRRLQSVTNTVALIHVPCRYKRLGGCWLDHGVLVLVLVLVRGRLTARTPILGLLSAPQLSQLPPLH